MSENDAELIRANLEVVAPRAGELTSHFYALLFLREPSLRELFPPAMDTQRDRLVQALVRIVGDLENAEALSGYLGRLGRDHRKFDVLAEHYTLVGECLVAALARYSGDTWNQAVADAWGRAYTAAAGLMTGAADLDAAVNPAHWAGEIVAHERPADDIAVVTVRPDAHYPYRAGQYATVETPWWPRVWRAYSIANAPDGNGLLTFHVRAVPAGWVSNALVRKARVGDRVKLGPAQGEMVVDHRQVHPVLCVAGGTGLAPLRAIVEEIAYVGSDRFVDVFYGASTHSGLYGLDDLLRLAQRVSWLKVRPAVDDVALAGISGAIADVLAEYGPFYGCDAYLSGPPEMVLESSRVLRRLGLPAEQIHHDPVTLGFGVPPSAAAEAPRGRDSRERANAY
ncbi:globin domain-containing protein [Yinghuangia seranimata]|uniref:globin domain-containing protein n=1 Tax=Yinghuangia seranimata TaxID=408067 RepID=UPI00248BA5B0|nr:globin domain-containing protein [Yinghuangia seranimata]MDI2130341.1 globin domain-containing protein [Yinghuangia seranimata]